MEIKLLFGNRNKNRSSAKLLGKVKCLNMTVVEENPFFFFFFFACLRVLRISRCNLLIKFRAEWEINSAILQTFHKEGWKI